MKTDRLPWLAPLAALVLGGGPAMAQEELGARLLVELNAAESTDQGCKLSFVALNGHPSDLDEVVFETVFFDARGQVDRLTLLNFGALPAARPRVRQFVVADMACADLGQVLFNGASTCTSDDLPADACTSGLLLETKLDIEVAG